MTQPLALLLYEKLLPGGQLMNKLQDLGYRVLPVPEATDLLATAEREKPLVAFVDMEPQPAKAAAAIASLRAHETTAHIPVIAFATSQNEAAQEAARQAGARLVTHDTTILAHLNHFLEQALQVD